MAIALRAAGTATGATATATTLNPSSPAGVTSSDFCILVVAMKPYNTSFSSTHVTTISGVQYIWRRLFEGTNGTTASAADAGSTKIVMYYIQDFPASTAVGAISASSANSGAAVVLAFSKTATSNWDFSSFTTGGDTTDGANYSATGAAGISVSSGDYVVWGTAVNGDIGTLSAIALGGMSGATIGTADTTTNQAVTTGNDSRLLAGSSPITAGSSSAAPTITYTNASTGSGTSGWLRLREATPAKIDTFVSTLDGFTAALETSPTSTGSSSYTGGVLLLAGGAGYAFAGTESTARYDLYSSSVYVKVPTVVAATAGVDERLSVFRFRISDRDYVQWYIYTSGGTRSINATYKVAGSETSVFTTTYSSTDHLWWKISEASGTVHWYTSTDGTTWTERGAGWAHADAIPLANLQILFQSTGTLANTTEFDSLNMSAAAVARFKGVTTNHMHAVTRAASY